MKQVIVTKIGEIEVIVNEGLVMEVSFVDQSKGKKSTRFVESDKNDKLVLKSAAKELREYFESNRKKFELPIRLEGTDFQKRVWSEIGKIPYGQMMTYKELAESIGNGKAYRAVANACGANPIPIIIPCHRVVGSNGGLGGYNGGLWRKKWLLDMEKSI